MSKIQPPVPHELHEFLRQVNDTMAQEYARIRKRASEDPGTAGDEGEENWAELLRRWLPSSCTVVTKGRIIGPTGVASPQVDLLVLRPGYPKAMVNKKLYLSGGVAAAFECKLTLEPKHLRKIAATAVAIRRLLPERNGTVYRELNSSLLYGALAHSSTVSGRDAKGIESLLRRMEAAGNAEAIHPRELIDVLCVSDLATLWTIRSPRHSDDRPDEQARFAGHIRPISAHVVFAAHRFLSRWADDDDASLRQAFSPIGALLAVLLRRLAWEMPDLRPIADHFRLAGLLVSGGGGYRRFWPTHIFSDSTVNTIVGDERWPSTDPDEFWDEWSWGYV